jgi:hypothetical protein
VQTWKVRGVDVVAALILRSKDKLDLSWLIHKAQDRREFGRGQAESGASGSASPNGYSSNRAGGSRQTAIAGCSEGWGHRGFDPRRSLRGEVVDARLAYPDVLHAEGRDAHGDLWRLATQDAEWLPTDPAQLVGRRIEAAEIDEMSASCVADFQMARCSISNQLRAKPRMIRPTGN